VVRRVMAWSLLLSWTSRSCAGVVTCFSGRTHTREVPFWQSSTYLLVGRSQAFSHAAVKPRHLQLSDSLHDCLLVGSIHCPSWRLLTCCLWWWSLLCAVVVCGGLTRRNADAASTIRMRCSTQLSCGISRDQLAAGCGVCTRPHAFAGVLLAVCGVRLLLRLHLIFPELAGTTFCCWNMQQPILSIILCPI